MGTTALLDPHTGIRETPEADGIEQQIPVSLDAVSEPAAGSFAFLAEANEADAYEQNRILVHDDEEDYPRAAELDNAQY